MRFDDMLLGNTQHATGPSWVNVEPGKTSRGSPARGSGNLEEGRVVLNLQAKASPAAF